MNFLKGIRSRQGFTLLELMIVVVIVGVLAIIIVPNLISGPTRARDSQRKADLQTIKNTLEGYYNDNNSYPVSLEVLTQGNTPYSKGLPTDPKTKAAYIYITAGSPPNSYILKTELENNNDKDAKSGTSRVYQLNSSN